MGFFAALISFYGYFAPLFHIFIESWNMFFPALCQIQKSILFEVIISHSGKEEPFYSATGCKTQADFKDVEETCRGSVKVENSV